MHVPDGIVPLWLQILMLIASAIMMTISFKKISRRFDERLIPFMGVLAAVIFAAQLVNFPVPPFSSGHLVGSTLLAVMVGPWVAMLIMALVLFVQALYGDGGILSYGLNVFNMGVFSVLLGYGLAVLLFRMLRRLVHKERATILSAGTASFFVTIGAAFILGLQLLTVPGFGIEALSAITAVHIIVGFGEAVLTSIILLYFVKANPQLVMFLRDTPEDDERDESLESQESQSSDRIFPVKQTIPIVAFSIIVIAALIIGGVASANPDGFEWALFRYAGVPEPEAGFDGIWKFLGESSIAEVVSGALGIIAALGLGILLFRRAAHETDTHKHSSRFLLPFENGRRAAQFFSPTGMILSSIALAALVSIQATLSVVLVMIGLILTGGWIAQTRWRRVISLAFKFEVIILFWIIFEPFVYGSTVIFTVMTPWGPLNAYSEGLYFGLLLGSRMLAILLVFLATLSHMTLSDFVGALRSLRIPASILGSLLIMFRYVPLFIEERTRMQDAQLLRGFDRGRRTERIRSLGYMLGTTINRSFDRSIITYEAMSLRGFGKGSMVIGAGFKKADALLPVLIISLFAISPFAFPLILEVLIL
ncbi:MAG: energy-coupling factor ABC transporter permease [Candidatus Thorarchaeota archaeon]